MLRLRGEYLSSLLLPTLARDISGRQAERGHWPRAGRKSTCGVPREFLWLRRHKGAAVDGIWSYTSPPKAGRGLGGKPGAVTALATAQLKPWRWLSSTAGDQTCKRGDGLVPKHTSSHPGRLRAEVVANPGWPWLRARGLTWENWLWCW